MRWNTLARNLPGYRCLLLASIAIANSAFPAEPENLLNGFRKDQLIIETDLRCIQFSVYIAENRQQRAQGLMNIQSMPLDEGMIFIYPQPDIIFMWMKNTLIPLDMIFIAIDGRLVNIAAHTKPMSEAIIQSAAKVKWTLELNAGAAEHFGIRPGNRLIYLP